MLRGVPLGLVPEATSVVLVAAVAALAAVGAAGCAHDAADRHAAELRESMARSEAEHERIGQRLGARELVADDRRGRDASPGGPAASRATPGPTTPPVPHVVQLGSGENDGASDDPNDPTTRPKIEVSGPAGASRSSRSGRNAGRRDTRIDVVGPDDDAVEGAQPGTAPGSSDRPSALDPEARKAYDAALALVKSRDYTRALEALTAFLTRWPDHPYAENAMYWRGEAHYGLGDNAKAVEQMEAVLARFPRGAKAPDALYKIAKSHENLGAVDRARETFARLRSEFPRSDAAKKIPGEPSANSRERARPNDDRSPKGPKETR